jgi:filamentous hemagglutinin family protein
LLNLAGDRWFCWYDGGSSLDWVKGEDRMRTQRWPRTIAAVGWAIATIPLMVMPPVVAQTVVPDTTLGAESSTVTPDEVIRGVLSDRIEGGATRGSNLFHSFERFNIDAGRGVYFANPAGIENILSRVTGNSRSDIFGRLGVLGNANLFLLNPNGIVFGPNADLDIAGSFTATTANAIQLGDRGFFGATQPQQSSLLAVAPGALLYDQIAAQGGRLVNTGNLTAGQDLTLAANNLELQGQLRSGRDLTLEAQDTVRIRDSVTAPFVAGAGRDLLVQGNQAVDIFALNHPNSGLASGGDMVLRSASPVGGDAHYYSGGNFRIENLAGSGGGLFSPNDPIIFARGDVSFNTYQGASLHIFAGGSVTVTTGIAITAPDFFFGFSEDVALSDGTIVAIRGTSEPTVDIRAGIDQALFIGEGINTPLTGSFTGLPGQGFFSIPTGSDINIGAILFSDGVALIGGKVLLTNQYRPNPSLTDGNIQVSAIPILTPGPGIAVQTSSSIGDGGSVFIDSRGDIQARGVIATNSTVSNGGDVRLIAVGNINLAPTTFISSQGDVNIAIQSTGLVGGNINLRSDGNISIDRTAILSNSFATAPSGKAGGITLNANSIFLTNDSRISASSFGGAEAGDINLFANNVVEISGANSFIQSDTGAGTGFGSVISPDTSSPGGKITLRTGSLLIDDGAISALTANRGNAGNIDIQARDRIVLQNRARIANDIQPGSTGNGGITSIRSNSLAVLSGSQITSTVATVDPNVPLLTPGRGNSGQIDIRVNGEMIINGGQDGFLSGVSTAAQSGTIGNTGNILVEAGSLRMESNGMGASIFTDVSGTGDAGNVNIDVKGLLELSGFFANLSSVIRDGGTGNSGNIAVKAGSIEMTGFSQIAATHGGIGTGRAGNISIRADGHILLDGSGIQSIKGPNVIGRSGDVDLSASTLTILQGGGIVTSATEVGDAGNIRVVITDDATIDGFSSPINIPGFGLGLDGVASSISSNVVPNNIAEANSPSFENRAVGNSGNIYFFARNLTLSNGGAINNAQFGRGNSGSNTVEVVDKLIIRGFSPRSFSSIISQVDQIGAGNAGPITVQAGQLQVEKGARISSDNFGQGNAGNIIVQVDGAIALSTGGSITGTIGAGSNGRTGDIDIQARSLTVTDGSNISSALFRQQGNSPGGQGQTGTIRVSATDSIALSGSSPFGFSSGILTLSERGASGSAGDIFINTRDFRVSDGAIVVASTFNQGNAGNITITSENFTAANGGQVVTNTRGSGRAGTINLNVSDTLLLDGRDPNFGDRTARINQYLQIPGVSDRFDDVIVNIGPASGLFTNTGTGSTGTGGNIILGSANLNLVGGGQISAQSQGVGRAGNIFVDVRETFNANDGNILTNAQFSGGDVNITAKSIRLRGDSDITTNVTNGAGGNITLSANSILAFNDSDILSFAQQGQGGNITLNTAAFFGENYRPGNPPPFDGNDRVDINASGTVFGIITLPDVSFIQSSLTQLAQTAIDTNQLLATSCIVRRNQPNPSSFYITGPGGLPDRPGTPSSPSFPTGEIRNVATEANSSSATAGSQSAAPRPWQIGDPIQEPDDVYQLPNGELVLSHTCR